MTPYQTVFASASTSAAGAMRPYEGRRHEVIGLIVHEGGIAGTGAWLGTPVARPLAPETTSGTPLDPRDPAGPDIAELRRLTGLTWEQLASLFGTSRRALHFWASGKPMSAANEEHLRRVLGVIHHVDRGTARANRALLLTPMDDGDLPTERLARGEYSRVEALLGPGGGRRVLPPRDTAAALAARAPRSPEALVDARTDLPDPPGGRLRRATPVKRKGGK